MARSIHSRIEIDAPPERVWGILIDFEHYSQWNPFITRIQGEAVEGARLEVSIRLPGRKAMTFKPTVIRCEPEREFRWKGKLFLPGLFDGEHCFQIKPIGDHRVEFVQQEFFSGILAAPLVGMIGEATQQGFEAMNQALKTRAESRAPG